MAKDYYKILGVSRSATKDEVKKAYKNLAKKYHPDLNKDPDAADKFKEINEAASILADDQKRANYDRFGTAEATFGPGFDFSKFDFSDFGFGRFDFDSIFDDLFGGGFSFVRPERGRRGADLRYDLEVTLEESALGTTKKITFPRTEICKECNGSGAKSISDIETCNVCNGTGMQRTTRRTAFGIFSTSTTCGRCKGEGRVTKRACATCKGSGFVRKSKKIEVKIPAGVENGSSLRLQGLGQVGDRGGPAGNLYVVVHIKPHEIFERVGDDIYMEIPISFTQAVFGDEITVPTLRGKAKLNIPSGTQTNTIFKMSGKGIPHLNGVGSGSQMVKVIVQTPKRLTKKQRELLQEFAEESGEEAQPYKNIFDRIKGAF